MPDDPAIRRCPKTTEESKNLWLGQRSCSHTFDQIVALVKGRWPMVDKNFSTGGYLWVLTGVAQEEDLRLSGVIPFALCAGLRLVHSS